MAEDGEKFFAGLPVRVDPEAIERELSRLWKSRFSGAGGIGSVSRVCLSNVIFCLPNRGAWETAQANLPAIVRRYPSRIIVLSRPSERAESEEAAASISALCSVPEPGGVPVCCEEIMLEAPPRDLESLVTPLLVPDVPIAIVALFPGCEELIAPFLRIAERLIVDTRRDAGETLQFLSSFLERRSLSVRDLAWEATLPWRRVLADLFDEPEVAAIGRSLRRLEILYLRELDQESRAQGGTCRSGLVTAALLGGWLVSRLGLKLRAGGGDPRAQEEAAQADVDVILGPDAPGECPAQVSRARLLADEGDLSIRWDGSSFAVRFETKTACVLPRMFPVRPEDESALLGRALERSPPRRIFAEAARTALVLLGRASAAETRAWSPERD